MILPQVPAAYSANVENERNRSLQMADQKNRKVGENVELSDERLIIKSPDGSRFYLAVANDGTLSTTAL